MRKLRLSLLVMMALLVFTSLVSAAPPESKNFSAHLTGAAERPTPRDTNAVGQVIFQLSPDGTVLYYKLIVANIDNVAAAHIHCGGVDVAGPVGVTLYSGAPASFNGVLASGAITAPDASALAACGWADLGDVVDAMRAGSTYVNVHTNDLVAPPNSGAGDFQSGEIRGQITENGPSK